MMGVVSRRDWRVVVAIISGGHFFSHFYMLALPPLFPQLRNEFGLSNAELGLVVSLLMAGGLLQAPVGNLVDRIGAKWVFVTGVGVTAAGIISIGFGQSYTAILVLATISGLGQATFHPADYAMIDTVTEPKIQGRAFSIHTFSGSAGLAVAPIAVGTLGLLVGWRGALFIVGAIGVLYTLFSALILAPAYAAITKTGSTQPAANTDGSSSFLEALKRPGILVMVGFFLITAVAGKGIQTFTTVLAVNSFGFVESVGNILLTTYFTLGALGVLAGGVLADRFEPGRIIACALLIGSSILLVTVTGIISASATALSGLFGLAGFFISITTPSRDRFVSEMSASGTMGRSFGVVFTGGAVGKLSGPVFLGAMADASSVTLSFVLISAFYLIAGILAFSLGEGWLIWEPGIVTSEGD